MCTNSFFFFHIQKRAKVEKNSKHPKANMTMENRQSLAAVTKASSFPIPASLHDLERDPYNLLPYPYDFEDDDEAARADSFSALVDCLDDGNHALSTGGISLFENVDDGGDQESWMDEDRVQALYTLVR